jgi:hypothetical protein
MNCHLLMSLGASVDVRRNSHLGLQRDDCLGWRFDGDEGDREGAGPRQPASAADTCGVRGTHDAFGMVVSHHGAPRSSSVSAIRRR